MKNVSSIILAVSLVVLLAACGKKGPTSLAYIPNNVSYVVAINANNITKKLATDSLNLQNIIGVLNDNDPQGAAEKALQIWEMAATEGLDLQQPLFIAIPPMDLTTKTTTSLVVAALKDSKKIEAALQKAFAGLAIQKGNGYSYIVADNIITGWNEKAIILLTATNYDFQRFGEDTLGNNKSNSLPTLLNSYFSLAKNKSMQNDKAILPLLAEGNDISIFANSSNLATGNPAVDAMVNLPNLKALLEGNYSSTAINFEDGKISVRNNTHIGDALGKLLKEYAGPIADFSLVERYPGTPIGAVAFSFKPALIPGFLKESGLDALLGTVLIENGISAEEIAKAFKGDFAVVFSDFAVQQKKGGLGVETNPTAQLVAAFRIGDTTAFNKLVNLGAKMETFKKEGAFFTIPSSNLTIGVDKDLFIVATSPALYTAYAKGDAKAVLSNEMKNALKDASYGGSLDVKTLLNSLEPITSDSSASSRKGKLLLNEAKQMVNSFSFKSGNYNNGFINASGELLMTPGKNSLCQLVRFGLLVAETQSNKVIE